MDQPLIDARLEAELAALYAAPGRHYHGILHVRTLLRLAREYREALSDHDAVTAAIWFHDAVYDSRASDNEERSAALAVEHLAGRTSDERLSRIAVMIRATAGHAAPELGDEDATRDAALFLDMDLAILGSSPREFDRYEAAIRREYAWLAGLQWREGRAAILRKFLARPRIFHSAQFGQRFEASARRNLQRSISLLQAHGSTGHPGEPGTGGRTGFKADVGPKTR